ncbi:MAG TPA: fimbria/pilus outer membrane usher protein, partial [Xanthomonadales bacterium]|nr:fimbria/pilus outer membrane usher protein [Xanthomonadales bacterium]
GIVDASLAAGRNRVGSGARVALGFERQTPGLSFAVHGMWASPRFRQLGDFESALTVDREVIATAGYAFGRFGTASIAYVERHHREQPAAAIASLGYSLGLDRWGYVAASLTRVRGDGGSTAANVLWTVPFGAATSATLGIDRVRGASSSRNEVALTVQRNLPAGEGVGWRLRASDNGPRQAQIDLQGRYASLSAEAAEVQGRTGERVSLAGGIGAIADTVFLSRTIDDSFGVVRVRGYRDVRVYAQNQEIGRTDASGVLVVPRLLAYQRNALRIEQADLPFDAEFDALVQEAVPYARNGVVVDFAVHPARGALVTFVQENGDAVPPGARVRVEGSERTFAVAREGVAYLAGLAARNRVAVRWRDRTCNAEFELPATGDPQPRLGPFVCRSPAQ